MLEMAGKPTEKQMIERLLKFLREQLQRTTDPMKLHTIQGDLARLSRRIQ